MTQIKGGFYIIARKIKYSPIWQRKPSWWLKVWLYLIGHVNHKDRMFPRGTNFTSLRSIWEECCLLQNEGIKDFKNVDNVIRWLKKENLITTRKTTRGFHVTLCNYDYYQNAANYTNDTTDDTRNDIETISERHANDTINKNDNNDKKLKNNQPDKPAQFSKEFTEKAEKAKAFGFNIYQLLGAFYKKSKLREKLPEQVLGSVLDEILTRHEYINDPFPYFLTVVKDKSAQHFSQQNQKEGIVLKKGSLEIKDILASMPIIKKIPENAPTAKQEPTPVKPPQVNPGITQANNGNIDPKEIKNLRKTFNWDDKRIRDHFINVRGYSGSQIDEALKTKECPA